MMKLGLYIHGRVGSMLGVYVACIWVQVAQAVEYTCIYNNNYIYILLLCKINKIIGKQRYSKCNHDKKTDYFLLHDFYSN